jgi:hypothetical protein
LAIAIGGRFARLFEMQIPTFVRKRSDFFQDLKNLFFSQHLKSFFKDF